MPEEDLIVWVNKNWRKYAYRHIIGLLNMTLAGPSGKLFKRTHLINAPSHTPRSGTLSNHSLNSFSFTRSFMLCHPFFVLSCPAHDTRITPTPHIPS